MEKQCDDREGGDAPAVEFLREVAAMETTVAVGYRDCEGTIYAVHDPFDMGGDWGTYKKSICLSLRIAKTREEAQQLLDAWATEQGLERCCVVCGLTPAGGCWCSKRKSPDREPAWIDDRLHDLVMRARRVLAATREE